MKELKVRLTFLEEILGTASADPEIHETFIASNAPDAPTRKEEIEAYAENLFLPITHAKKGNWFKIFKNQGLQKRN